MNPQLARLQPYPFERLRTLFAGVTPPADRSAISLGIGEPQHATPAFITQALTDNLRLLGNYPATAGLPPFRAAVASWLTRRFRLPAGALDAESMVLPVNGTREALFAFVQAAIDASDTRPGSGALIAMPNPFYQIYEGAALLAGAEPFYIAADHTNGFLPDLASVPAAVWQRCQILFLCSPGNPTGAVASLEYLREALALADRYDFVVAADECYSEIYPDESHPPPGLLEAAIAAGHSRFERCMVFHSLSKRSNAPGLRSGFVAGDPNLIKPFQLYRTYHGCAMSGAVQLASIAAWNDEAHVIANRALYRAKFAAVVPILASVMPVEAPQASFYLWPEVGDGEQFAKTLFATQNVTVLPGGYLSRDFGGQNPGRSRIRLSLVADLEQCIDAAQRIREVVRQTGIGANPRT